MEAEMQMYIELCIIKKTSKISSTYEDKQKHNRNTKKKTEGDLEKE